ncbi:MAG TPA: hypothetical protein QGG47_06025 [Acidobacteriota bacterium]|nr:hypothetical protein [Acidobacteriota bacterium]
MKDGCGDFGELGPTTLTEGEVQDLRDSHIGNEVGGFCLSQRHTDRVARGYVTIDSVSSCTTLFPSDNGYFGEDGVANDNNVLWGEYTVLNLKRKYAETERLVSIEAAQSADTFPFGSYTFYGRYVGWDSSDKREPLIAAWGARYQFTQSRNTASQAIVWRDSSVVQEPFECNFSQDDSWYPLGQEQLMMFDEAENTTEIFGVPVPFPAETQQVKVGSNLLPTPFSFGWMFLNLGINREPRQSHVTMRHVISHKKMRSRVAGTPLVSDTTNSILDTGYQGCPEAPPLFQRTARTDR